MIKYLLGKASTGKFRWWSCECDEEWHEPEHGYIIQRKYGQVGGKTTESPAIIVDKTKQKRNWKEQYTLQFNSEVKKQLDKGYVEVEKHPNEYSNEELEAIFGEVKTNQLGVIKPMLAKSYDKVTNTEIFDRTWYASRKLDGVRCLMYYKDGEIHTASRGGTNYDASTEHIRIEESLVKFFSNHPSYILDGELYRHGKTLQQISGAARMEKNAYDCDWLQFWIYDYYDINRPELTFKERKDIIGDELDREDVEICYINDEDWDTYEYETAQESFLATNEKHNFVLCSFVHLPVKGIHNIWKLHDQYVNEGYEGVVVRDPNKSYRPGCRSNDMIKFKKYKSNDFKVIGYKLGLRGSEDMTFTCELGDGRTFEAMPCGTREMKEEYVTNFDSKYKGHKAECTYFNLSDEGIPTQPKLRIFRFDLE